jgi:hypothetical protein
MVLSLRLKVISEFFAFVNGGKDSPLFRPFLFESFNFVRNFFKHKAAVFHILFFVLVVDE